MENLFILIMFVVYFYTLFQILKSNKSTRKKVLWFGFVFVFSWVGMIMYYFYGREKSLGTALHKTTTSTTKTASSISSTPKPTSTDFYVTCENCLATHTNPTNSLCSNCGKDMYKKDTNKKCSNCGSEYDNSLVTCPICGN